MAGSNDFPQFTKCSLEQVPQCVQNDLKRVAKMNGVSFDNKYYKYKTSIVIRLTLSIELPTRYDASTALVNSHEPVFVEFLPDYPDRAPRAYIGRSDFDFACTPHIYCDKDGLRPICLFRGNGDEWFANMEIEDYVKHLRSWYEDLASGVNIEDGGQFEPLRLEGYTGTLSYDYEQLSNEINMATNDHKNSCSLILVRWSDKKIIRLTGKNTWLLYTLGPDKNKKIQSGLVCWGQSKEPCDLYDTRLPRTYTELIEYSSRHGVGLGNVVDNDIESLKGHPSFIIILAIKRSKKLIGVNSFYQFVNFEILFDTDADGKRILTPSSKVVFHKQESPFTTNKAHEISNLDQGINPSLIVAGCGSLGSKVALHLVRSGITNILFSDPDIMSEHNLSRHVLFDNSVLYPKSDEMKKISNLMYYHENMKADSLVKEIKKVLEDSELMKKRYPEYLLDFTASKVVFNQLVNIKNKPTVVSAAIYDNGKFGLLLCEGGNGGLRLDDILISFYAQYKTDPYISNFLVSEKAHANEPSSLLNVGLGCNSETFILADDVISLFASSMSMTVKKILSGNHPDGGGWLYKLKEDGSLQIQKIDVPQFYCYEVDNWKVRITDKVINDIINQTESSGDSETGGYLIGQCNLKTKTIHVFDKIEAPEDTIHRDDYLILGKSGLRKKLSQIERRSGSTFGYVGEWHSHPNGPESFSVVDYREFEKKAQEMAAFGITKPILEVLVTPVDIKYAILALS